jgi:regulator of sigma E protease
MLLFSQGKQIINSTTVGYVQEQSIAAQAGFQEGDKILSVSGNKVNTWNDVMQQFVSNMGNDVVFSVQRDGAQKNIIIKTDELSLDETKPLGISFRLPAVIGKLVPSSPAEKAGLLPGDKILSINGKAVQSWDDMTGIVSENADKPLAFQVERNGQPKELNITPEATDELDEEGNSHIVGKIGAWPHFEKQEVGFFMSFIEGFDNTLSITGLDVKALGWLVTGKKSAREMIGGPIMITKMAGEFAKSGLGSLFELIAHLSIMLAIVNVLPIPALDGGHITIVLIEQIRRKPLSTQTKLKIQQVGMAILLVLIIFIMYNDIARLL